MYIIIRLTVIVAAAATILADAIIPSSAIAVPPTHPLPLLLPLLLSLTL
jgi:hypothetical protein